MLTIVACYTSLSLSLQLVDMICSELVENKKTKHARECGGGCLLIQLQFKM